LKYYYKVNRNKPTQYYIILLYLKYFRMIIPVKCFTCGNVLADKYRYFLDEVRRIKIADGLQVEKVVYLTVKTIEKTPEGRVLDDIGLKNVCCRRHMLTHVDIE
jgi:DNA-directed RNA polymerase subunit N